MGGWTVLYYLLKYPPTASEIDVATEATQADVDPPDDGQGYEDRERPRKDEKERVQVAGAFVMCPMVEGMLRIPIVADESIERIASIDDH